MQGTVMMVAVAAVLWGANFNLSQIALTDLHPLAAAAGRFVLAALVMLAITSARGERVPLARHFRPYAVLGLVGVGGFNLLFFFAMQMTSAVNGALIMATNPLVTALLAAVLLGERPTPRQMAALPLALAGVSAVILGGGASLAIAPGDALMLAANLCWAGYNVLGRRLMPAGSGLANTTGVMVAGAVVLVAAALIVGAPVTVPGAAAGSALVAMGLGGSVLAYLFWNAGLARLGAARTSLFLNLVPVSAMTIAALTGDLPGPAQLTGGAVVLAAVTMASWPQRVQAAART